MLSDLTSSPNYPEVKRAPEDRDCSLISRIRWKVFEQFSRNLVRLWITVTERIRKILGLVLLLKDSRFGFQLDLNVFFINIR